MLHCLCVMYIVPTYIFSMHLHKRFGVLQMHLSGSQFAQFPSQYGPSDYVQLSRYRCIFSSRKELFTLWYLGSGKQCLHPDNVFEIFTSTKTSGTPVTQIYRMNETERNSGQPTNLTRSHHSCLQCISHCGAFLYLQDAIFQAFPPECGNV